MNSGFFAQCLSWTEVKCSFHCQISGVNVKFQCQILKAGYGKGRTGGVVVVVVWGRGGRRAGMIFLSSS